ncbi:MAG: hypothetical protein ABI697_09120 [Devosia sp.]
MRRTGRIVGIIFVVVGLFWVLQGSNVIGGSVMSGQSLWLYVGIALAIVGAVVAVVSWRRA